MTLSAKARDVRYGRRAGGWASDRNNEAPFGVVDNVKQPCPTPAYVTCGCQVVDGWWVVPAAVGKSCHACGERYTRAAA